MHVHHWYFVCTCAYVPCVCCPSEAGLKQVLWLIAVNAAALFANHKYARRTKARRLFHLASVQVVVMPCLKQFLLAQAFNDSDGAGNFAGSNC